MDMVNFCAFLLDLWLTYGIHGGRAGWYLRQKPVGGIKAGGLPHPSLSPFPPLPLSIPRKFSDKPVGGKVRSSEGKFPGSPPLQIPPCAHSPAFALAITECVSEPKVVTFYGGI